MLARLRDLFSSTPVSSKAKQEMYDLAGGLLMARYRSLRLGEAEGPGDRGEARDVEALRKLFERAVGECEEEFGGKSLHGHRSEWQKCVGVQSRAILESLLVADEDVSPELRVAGGGKLAHLKGENGFVLRADESGVAGAGKGIFIDGEAISGTLLGYLPGRVHVAEFLKGANALEQFADDPNHLVLMRTDDILIDARDFDGVEHPTNPYALGHLANHPPEGKKPNVMHLPIDFASDAFHSQTGVSDVLPNSYAKKPTLLGTPDKSACMYGMAMVALRDVKDEELFLNYRFNPDAPGLPQWYAPVDDDQDRRRWSDK